MTHPGLGSQPQAKVARHRRLSSAWVFFLVISAASPLTTFIGGSSLGLDQGNGAGYPAAYLAVTVVLLCFAVGYAAISSRVINTGAFYTYIARGIGRPPAIGGALLAVIAYTANVAGIAGGTGYFITIIAAEFGAHVSWIWGSVAALVFVSLLGYRSLHLSANVLGTVTVLVIGVLVVFDVAVLVSKGLDALPAASFSPGTVFSGSPGIAAMFAFTSFVGMETAALYGEETVEPEHTVPKAIYAAVGCMGVLYVLSTWILVGSIGPGQVDEAVSRQTGTLVFDQMAAYGGEALRSAAALLFVVACLAAMLAFHNSASRYLFVLGRDRILPAAMGRLHPRHRSPQVGSVAVSVGSAVIVAVAALADLDPYRVLAQGAVTLGTLGVLGLQTVAAVAIVAFFRRRGQGRYWRTLILPGIGAAGLFAATIFLLLNFASLLGGPSALVTALPWLFVAVMAAGVVTGLVIRARQPARYARLAESRLRPQARELRRPQRWLRRYCLIGAGPAGVAMARRLVEEGIPFDWFDRYGEIGGIWNAERLDSPVHDGCVAISSKFTSGFADFPMPAGYPDYPSWSQVRDYVRAYAEHHDLTGRVTFNTAVTWVKPDGVGWLVTLTSGDFRYYSGVIAAPGTAWHPALPIWPGQERFEGQIWHSSGYRSATELAGRRVLVVGAGNSGAEIACEAVRAGASVCLSVRRGHRFVPRYIGGVTTDAILAGVLAPPDAMTLPPDPGELIEKLVGDVAGLPAPHHTVLNGHPTVTDDLLGYLSQGRIVARPDVAEILPQGVRYTDRTAEQVDVIIAATGYERRLPFLAPELYRGSDGRPDLYLNLFSRSHDGLVVLGLSEFAGATFPRFDDMARVAIVDITLRELGGVQWRAWRASKQSDRPRMRGGKRFVDSPRHEFFVDDHAYQMLLGDVCDRFGYIPGTAAPVRNAAMYADAAV